MSLEAEQVKRNAQSADENVRKFYLENREYCEQCYSYYGQYSSKKEKYVNPVFYDKEEQFKKNLKGIIVLVITANPIEEGILLHGLSDVTNQKNEFYFIDNYAYQVSFCNDYTIVHVHAHRTGEEFTRRAINAATNLFMPDFIVLLGICYGLDYMKHKLGNVFISDSLKTYRLNFRDSEVDDETIFEAEEEYHQNPNNRLLNMIKAVLSYREVYSQIREKDGTQRSVRWDCGTILSSNSLMSSRRVKEAVKEALCGVKPKPLGGEMEGGGLLKTKVVEEQHFDNWLVIKSICDWGEKKNLLDPDPSVSELMKDSIQAVAMVHAWSTFYEMLNQKCFNKIS